MAFSIDYKDFKSKDETNRNLTVLADYLNSHLIGKHYGWTFTNVVVQFVNFPKPSKKLKAKTLYKIFASVEVASAFEFNDQLSVEQFKEGYELVKEAVLLADGIQVEDKDYDFKAMYEDLLALPIPSTVDELDVLESESKQIRRANTAKRVDGLIGAWKQYVRPCDRQVVGVRIYDRLDREALWPFGYVYSELLSNLVLKFGITSPGYQEIYFQIAETLEEAKQEIAMESWHKYTYCQLDIEKFKTSSDDVKQKMLFESLKEGLLLIADFDHLDMSKIQQALDYIEENGIDSELTYSCVTKGNMTAKIVFKIPRGHRNDTAYFLELTDTDTNETGRVKIDEMLSHAAPSSFGKIKIKKKTVEIVGRKSVRAEISRELEGVPDKYEFSIESIMSPVVANGS
mgnify:CR=1 FL=1